MISGGPFQPIPFCDTAPAPGEALEEAGSSESLTLGVACAVQGTGERF